MELKMMFYLSNVAIAVNISQPSVRIGGGLHALIHIFFLHGGSKSPKPHWDLKWRAEITRGYFGRSALTLASTISGAEPHNAERQPV